MMKKMVVALLLLFFFVNVVFGGDFFGSVEDAIDEMFQFEEVDQTPTEQTFHDGRQDASKMSKEIILAYESLANDNKETCFAVFDAPTSSVLSDYFLTIEKTGSGMKFSLFESKNKESNTGINLPVFSSPVKVEGYSPCVVYGDPVYKFYEVIDSDEDENKKFESNIAYGQTASEIILNKKNYISFWINDPKKRITTQFKTEGLDKYFIFKDKKNICLIPTKGVYSLNPFNMGCSEPDAAKVFDEDCLQPTLLEKLQKNNDLICTGYKEKIMAMKT